MKWKLSTFREPFQAHRVGEEASELRPDMGPQRHAGRPSGQRNAVQNRGKIGNRKSSGTSTGRSTIGTPSCGGILTRVGPTSGGIYALGRTRRVIVKASFRKHIGVRRGGSQRVLAAHVHYLARPDATQIERHEAFFDGIQDATNAANIAIRWARDRHHWRLILSPEEGDQLDLKRYVRDYVERLRNELDTPLEWVAVTHHNTDSPHAHLLVRGRRGDGRDLVIPRETVSERLREWAQELATRTLGERLQIEADTYLNRLAEARRPNELDTLLARIAAPPDASPEDGGVFLDVQVPREWSPELVGRHHLERRLDVLAKLGLAERTSPPLRRAKWRLRSNFITRLEEFNLPDAASSEAAQPEAESVSTARQQQQLTTRQPHDRNQPHRRQASSQKSPVRQRNQQENASTHDHGFDGIGE